MHAHASYHITSHRITSCHTISYRTTNIPDIRIYDVCLYRMRVTQINHTKKNTNTKNTRLSPSLPSSFLPTIPPSLTPPPLSHLRGAISPGVSNRSNAVPGRSGSGFKHAGSKYKDACPAVSSSSTFTDSDVRKGRSKWKLPGISGRSEAAVRTWLAK